MDYAELQCRTNFSFLRGGSHAHELVEQAVRLGYKGLAITDWDGVYGVVRAHQAAKDHPGFKLLIGAEVSFENHPSITLIAQNRVGYGVLCRLLTLSHTHVEKGRAALRWWDFEKQIAGHAGLVALLRDGADFRFFKDHFEGRVYFPITYRLDGRDDGRLALGRQVEADWGIPLVATNDVHYHHPERRKLQDVLTCIREGVTLDTAGKHLFSNSESYLKSPAQMAKLFRHTPHLIENALRVAESCSFSLSELRYQYPSEWIPQGETAQSYLERLTWEGARSRYSDRVPDDVRAQLERELKLIHELKFEDYFLTIWEIVEFAKQRKILCQGRGSAANSAVCFCLGITAVDPVRMNLLFERFISSERGEPPDIDVDFEHERREEVIQHIYEKYGRDRAAMVSAVRTYRSRSAIREISKVLGKEISRDELKQGLKNETKDKTYDDRLNLIQDLTEDLKGFPRHLSIHSGGFTLSAQPIIEIVPVEPARMEGRTIIQWDKYDLDNLGLLKIDVLSLGILSAIRKTLDLIQKTRALPLTLATIPPEDPKTYAMMGRGETVGVFQIESRAQMNMLGRLEPRTFYDLVVQVAIVRPGPIVGQMVHPYLRRRRGEEKVTYDHPKLQEILGKTLGVPLFQEQVMKMAIDLAGFTPGEADQLRRAIGAWRSSGSIEKVGARLMQGLLASGLSEGFVKRIFEQIKGFAEYGFPESHAASFALLAYASAYLKCHYPAHFTCSLLNSQPMGFYANHSLVDEVKRQGVEVRPVDVRFSDWDCTLEGEPVAIRLGLKMVRGLWKEECDQILTARSDRGFRSLEDLMIRCGLRKNTLQALALGHALQGFGGSQRDLLWKILSMQNLKGSLFYQMGLDLGGNVSCPLPSMNAYDTMVLDYRWTGLSVKGHPMEVLRQRIPHLPVSRSRQIRNKKTGAWVEVAGLIIVRQHPHTARGTVFATLEDEEGFLDLVLRPEVFEKYEDVFLSEAFLVVKGILHRDTHASSVVVKEVQSVKESGLQVQSRDFK